MKISISKKSLSLLLVMTVACGLLFTAAAVADEEESYSASGSTVIDSAEDLEDMTSGDYVLGANITIDATTWTPISKFSGTFDGNGYTITWTETSESSMESVDSYFAIFGTSSGTIKNLTVDGTLYVTDSSEDSDSDVDYVSTVVGYNVGVISNVTNKATLYTSGSISYVGGIAGYNAGIISYSANEANITGYSQVGGIAGENAGIIEVCSNTGNIYGTRVGNSGIGGIAGRNGDNSTTTTASIRNCYNQGYIVSGDPSDSDTQGRWVGGICGFQNSLSSCTNCYNTGDLVGRSYVDHTAGKNEGTVTNCYGLDDIQHQTGAENEDGTNRMAMANMQDQSFVDTLNTNAGTTLWVYKQNDYPTLVVYSPGANYTFAMTTQPTKTTYIAGDNFDSTGMVITATSTSSSTTVASSNYAINPNRTLIASDTCVIVLGTYDGASFSFIVPITVYPAGNIYLDGTAEENGDGTADNPYNSLTSALNAATATGGTIYVCGTVTIPSGNYYDSVTFKRASGFSGALFSVTSGTVRMAGSTMVIDGDGSGTLFEVTGGTLQLRGGVTLQSCDTAVAVDGGTVEVNYTSITASQYSISVADASSTFTLQSYGSTTISGTVYLGTGAVINVATPTSGNVAVPCALTVECAGFQTLATPITVAVPDSGVTLTASLFVPSDTLYYSSIDSNGNVVFRI